MPQGLAQDGGISAMIDPLQGYPDADTMRNAMDLGGRGWVVRQTTHYAHSSGLFTRLYFHPARSSKRL